MKKIEIEKKKELSADLNGRNARSKFWIEHIPNVRNVICTYEHPKEFIKFGEELDLGNFLGLIYIYGEVNGKQVKILIYTGSEASIIIKTSVIENNLENFEQTERSCVK